jgi:hypothetical protein
VHTKTMPTTCGEEFWLRQRPDESLSNLSQTSKKGSWQRTKSMPSGIDLRRRRRPSS